MALSKTDELIIKNAVTLGVTHYFEELEKQQGFSMAEHTKNHMFTMGIEQNAATLRKAGIWGAVSLIFTAIGLVYVALSGRI